MAQVKTMRIIWNPINERTRERGPTVQDWPNSRGENEQYFADEIEGEYYIDVPYGLGQHLLTEESPKWTLLSPSRVTCQCRTAFGGTEMRTFEADKNIVKKFEALFKKQEVSK